ncbi:MAG: TraB/GumN family protein [Pseudomonadota bacterium]
MLLSRFWRRDLRMVRRVRKQGRESFLVGTAHFSPYSFRRHLTGLIEQSDFALFEGPLDPPGMERVVAAGMEGRNAGGLLDELDEKTLKTIARILDLAVPERSSLINPYMPEPSAKNLLDQTISTMKPWMAFFGIYTAYLKKKGWRHSVDMEAYEIARELGKTTVFMETIEEQIEVLETLSCEQMADFLKRIDSWSTYTRYFMRWYLNGDLTQIARNPYNFPTRNPWVIDRRDAIFCERMGPYLERGRAAVFGGVPHMTGVSRILIEEGYEIVHA